MQKSLTSTQSPVHQNEQNEQTEVIYKLFTFAFVINTNHKQHLNINILYNNQIKLFLFRSLFIISFFEEQ